MRRTRPLALSVALLLLSSMSALAAETSEVLKLKRPAGGEFFGLYLNDKKVGYVFQHLELLPGPQPRVKSVNELYFRAGVGTKVAERRHVETRVYDAAPGGRLLSFTVDQKGDGGDQLLEGTATPTGLTVVIKRPGFPNKVLNLPRSKEVVEDADQIRMALKKRREVRATMLDGQDLQQYTVTTKVGPTVARTISGVTVKLHSTVTMSDKEKVPVTTWVTESGEIVEIDFAGSMRARAENEQVAKRLDQVEVFGLTRVVLPNKLPASAHQIPGAVTLVLSGLPEQFRKDTYRQKFRALPDGRVEVKLSASPPVSAKAKLPVKDPAGGANLKADLMVESDHAEIVELAKRLTGQEKDAYTAAKKIVSWVGTNLKNDYGSSADRATDVLRQLRGDCTEHSLLSVALLRAAGIPARRKDGVVYLVQEDGVPALYWHQWVEAYVGEWTQLDPTFEQPIADATHFAVGEEGNAEITPLIGTMKVVEVR